MKLLLSDELSETELKLLVGVSISLMLTCMSIVTTRNKEWKQSSPLYGWNIADTDLKKLNNQSETKYSFLNQMRKVGGSAFPFTLIYKSCIGL